MAYPTRWNYSIANKQKEIIHTKDVGNAVVANSAQNMPKIGEEEEQFKAFVERSKLVTDLLKKTKQQKYPFKRQS